MLVEIFVSRSHIEGSNPKIPMECPLYRAMKPYLQNNIGLKVLSRCVQFISHSQEYTWKFDEQIPPQLNERHPRHISFTLEGLEPFSFLIDIPKSFLADDVSTRLADIPDKAHTFASAHKVLPANQVVILSNQDQTILMDITFAQIEQLYHAIQKQDDFVSF